MAPLLPNRPLKRILRGRIVVLDAVNMSSKLFSTHLGVHRAPLCLLLWERGWARKGIPWSPTL